MPSANPFAILFGKSPIKPMQEHMAVVADAAMLKGLAVGDRVTFDARDDGGDPLFIDLYHPTARGHDVAARTIAEALRDAGWLER